jgi:ABC-type transport system involved in multi-copper enzyme maturation permease subunit
MRQFFTIAINAFMELIRQPIFLLLMTASVLFEIFLAVPYYFGFGDEPKLVENSVLAVMLLSGLLGAVLSASASLAREIQRGTALAVLSKPVGRAQFFLAKYAGLAAALTVLTYVNLVGVLLASRMAFDAYGSTDIVALGIFATGVAIAYGLAGFSNFFLRRPFVSDAVLAIVVFTTLAALIIFRFTQQMASMNEVGHVDWRLVPAGILILFAVWILAALALACSTRLDTIPTLAICSAFFLIGLTSDYMFGRHMEPIWQSQPVWQSDMRDELHSSRWSENQKALLKQIVEKYDKNNNGMLESSELLSISAEDKSRLMQAGMGGSWWASVLYTVIPNWQYFWLADAIDLGKSTFQWNYVGKAFAYMAAYAGAVLAIGIVLFEERELS